MIEALNNNDRLLRPVNMDKSLLLKLILHLPKEENRLVIMNK